MRKKFVLVLDKINDLNSLYDMKTLIPLSLSDIKLAQQTRL